ncbi:MAG TPA: orotate phosphoribosyltransferase [Aliicoccus persicus]|uniref:Orotate phosphoribosyltransferase n=1 Tax=Aliicoccus persicus TaxID=930138 RepID=A0A921B5M2_9STAP|nr:orotate phosphoribosyltransferase [Aliicoccus persicus]
MREESIAGILLDIDAVMIRPNDKFTWASGIQSPIYCDNRKIIGDVAARRAVAKRFVELIEGKNVDVIAGTSTAGIPHAAFIAEEMSLPMSYVRGSKKAHGTGAQIEGADVKGKRVVLIEDLVSTGGSSLEAVSALKEAGAEVVNVTAIFTYELDRARENFEASGVELLTLSNVSTLLSVSVDRGDLSEADVEEVREFLSNL